MNSKINLMNIAIDFLPTNGGTNIKSINDSVNLGFRSNEEELIIVEYIYNDKEYTMILRQKNDEWEISKLYNYINLDEIEYNSNTDIIEEDLDRSFSMDDKFIVDSITGDLQP